jgi:hypothetical protein
MGFGKRSFQAGQITMKNNIMHLFRFDLFILSQKSITFDSFQISRAELFFLTLDFSYGLIRSHRQCDLPCSATFGVIKLWRI